MEIVAYIAIGFLIIRVLIVMINVVTPVHLESGEIGKQPFVSILIPARNEEKNIGRLLTSLEKMNYDNYEILVYDDESEDRTASILADYASVNYRIVDVRSEALPSGWLGKNHACHQLALAAKGEILLFLDADVEVSPELLRDAVAELKRRKLGLLSIFPQQKMVTAGEWMTVPLMNWILVTLLPLIFIRIIPWRSFSAANGQFMMFEGELYRRHYFHEMMKDRPVEDIQIIRKMKELGYKVETLLSNGQVSCRMYDSYQSAVNGFSKNIIDFFGGYVVMFALFVALTTFGIFFVAFSLPLWVTIAYFLLALALRLTSNMLNRQWTMDNALFAIGQQFSLVVIFFTSIYYKYFGRMKWKGRVVN